MECRTRLSPVLGNDDVGPLTASWAPEDPSRDSVRRAHEDLNHEVHTVTNGPLARTANRVDESQVASMVEICSVVSRFAVAFAPLEAKSETTPLRLSTV